MDSLNNFDWNFCYEHANSLPFGYSSWCAEQGFNLPLPEVNLSEMLPEISMDDFEEVYYANPLEDILDDNQIGILDDKPQIEQVFNLPLPEVDETALDNLGERLPEFSLNDLEDILDDNPIEDILGDELKTTPITLDMEKQIVV